MSVTLSSLLLVVKTVKRFDRNIVTFVHVIPPIPITSVLSSLTRLINYYNAREPECDPVFETEFRYDPNRVQ